MAVHDSRLPGKSSKASSAPTEKVAPSHVETPIGETDWDAGQILQLQRLVGNKAVHRLMRERTVQREAHGKGCNCGSCSSLQREAILQRVDEHEEDIQATRIQREGHEKGCGCASCAGGGEDIQTMRIQRVDEHEEDIQASRIQRDPDPVPTATVTAPPESTTTTTTAPETTPENNPVQEPEAEHGPMSLVDTIKEMLKTVTDVVQAIQDYLKGAWDSTVANDDAMKEIATKLGARQFLAAGMLVKAPLHQQLSLAIKYWGTVSLPDIRPSIEAAPQSERDVVWNDGTLMGDLKTKLGNDEYLNMQPILGVFKPGTTAEDGKSHTRADKADQFIRQHLSSFVGEAVKAGRKVEGQVAVVDGTEWADAYKREFGDDGEENTTNAFVERSANRTIWIHKSRGNAGTIIHEGVHKYTVSAFISDVGFNFNEGVTEYFTRKVTSALGYKRGNYEPNFLFAKQFATFMGDDLVAKAYFDGSVDDLVNAYGKKMASKSSIFESMQTLVMGDEWYAKKVWGELKTKVRAKDWAGATNLVK